MAAKKRKYSGAYDSEIAAVRAVSVEMRELTDKYNLEYAVFIKISRGRLKVTGERVPKGKYVTSRLIKGKQNNVVLAAILHCFSNFLPQFILRVPRKIIVHTHPDAEGYINNVFSGDPEKWWVFGDVSVPTILRYSCIYLVAPNGCLYKFDGIGEGDTKARTLKALRALPPLATDIPKSTVRYLKDKKSGRYYATTAHHESAHGSVCASAAASECK